MKERTRKPARINPRSRPNKLSYGMTATAHLRGHSLNDDALELAVKGTLDKLARSLVHPYRIWGESAPCRCCGMRRKVARLNPAKRWILAKKRKERAQS